MWGVEGVTACIIFNHRYLFHHGDNPKTKVEQIDRLIEIEIWTKTMQL